MKVCKNCKEQKPFDEFYPAVLSPSGYTARCKDCLKARHKEILDNDPAKAEARRQYYKDRYATRKRLAEKK